MGPFAALRAYRSAKCMSLWAQLQQSGKVVTVPFVLHVAEASAGAPAATPKIPPGAIRVRVTAHGYDPSSLQVPVGKPATLAFTRDGAPNCGAEVVFPALGIRQKLPLNQTALVPLPPQQKGELAFACGMGMFRKYGRRFRLPTFQDSRRIGRAQRSTIPEWNSHSNPRPHDDGGPIEKVHQKFSFDKYS